jgi:hypothetical protein
VSQNLRTARITVVAPAGRWLSLMLNPAESTPDQQSAISNQQLYSFSTTVLPPATEYTYYVLKIENGFIAGNNVDICRSQS